MPAEKRTVGVTKIGVLAAKHLVPLGREHQGYRPTPSRKLHVLACLDVVQYFRKMCSCVCNRIALRHANSVHLSVHRARAFRTALPIKPLRDLVDAESQRRLGDARTARATLRRQRLRRPQPRSDGLISPRPSPLSGKAFAGRARFVRSTSETHCSGIHSTRASVPHSNRSAARSWRVPADVRPGAGELDRQGDGRRAGARRYGYLGKADTIVTGDGEPANVPSHTDGDAAATLA